MKVTGIANPSKYERQNPLEPLAGMTGSVVLDAARAVGAVTDPNADAEKVGKRVAMLLPWQTYRNLATRVLEGLSR
jgi:hypothetical protein